MRVCCQMGPNQGTAGGKDSDAAVEPMGNIFSSKSVSSWEDLTTLLLSVLQRTVMVSERWGHDVSSAEEELQRSYSTVILFLLVSRGLAGICPPLSQVVVGKVQRQQQQQRGKGPAMDCANTAATASHGVLGRVQQQLLERMATLGFTAVHCRCVCLGYEWENQW